MKISKSVLITTFIAMTLLSSNAFAKMQRCLSQVMYQTSAEQWVTTDTVNIIVQINASLDKSGLEQARNQIMANLQQIAKGEWHITRFDRSQDSSGLESLDIEAQVRLPQSQLTDLRDSAKKVSQPGATYTINQIDFTPSLAEVEATREKLRNQLYLQAKAELARVNGIYPEQHFNLKLLNFTEGFRPLAKVQALGMAEMAPTQAATPPIQVSNKVNMTVTAVFAAGKPEKEADVTKDNT